MPFELDERFIVAAEKQLGTTLPSDYRQAMLMSNGGEVFTNGDLWQFYPIFDQTNRKRISRTCNHIIRETESMREWNGWPADALAIGHDGSGNVLAFIMESTGFSPNVFVWDHETGEIRNIADNFRDFSSS